MYNDILAKIESMTSGFSKGQKLIASYILGNFDKAAYMTASKLGDEAGVSESTVVRFANELGLSGYPELQREIRESVRKRLTSVQRMEVTSTRMGDSDILSTILNYDISKIKEQIEDKRLWFKVTFPEFYALEVSRDKPFFDGGQDE